VTVTPVWVVEVEDGFDRFRGLGDGIEAIGPPSDVELEPFCADVGASVGEGGDELAAALVKGPIT
jgi:hypothetical protein